MAERKRNEGPERQALREMMAGYLKDNPVNNGNDGNDGNDVNYINDFCYS